MVAEEVDAVFAVFERFKPVKQGKLGKLESSRTSKQTPKPRTREAGQHPNAKRTYGNILAFVLTAQHASVRETGQGFPSARWRSTYDRIPARLLRLLR